MKGLGNMVWSMAAVMLTTLAWSCTDDLSVDGSIPQGETFVNIEASFEPFSAMKVNGAGAKAAHKGDVMADLSDIALIAYDTDGNILEGYPVALDYTPADVSDEDRTGNDASSGETSETSTKCVRKQLRLGYGEYYLVAVANMGEYSDAGAVVKTTLTALLERPRTDYDTLDKLRSLERRWDDGNIQNNRMMTGFFTDKDKEGSTAPSSTDDFMPVRVDRSSMNLRTWLRRAASKVTVDFDGTGLRENVKIYIRDVQLHDIPKECAAGFGKKMLADGSFRSFNNSPANAEDLLAGSGQAIVFGEGDDYAKWAQITKGTPYIMDDATGEKKNLHSNSAQALFFYENMQGDAPHCKGPVTDLSTGNVSNSNTVKDEVPYGTYIEVTAFYTCTASDNMSTGDIKYRFMLGKDADLNCDAERNHHFKVTLKFNGNANDFSWHVDYKEEPDTWDVPQPWYVSYLYNHKSTIPFKYTPEDGYEVVRFEAEIVKNPWEPDIDPEIPIPSDSKGAFDAPENKQPGNGFLSLRYDNNVVVTPAMCGESSNQWPGYDNNASAVDKSSKLNNNYFYGTHGTVDQSRRTIHVDGTPDNTPSLNETGFEDYSYQKRGQSVSVNLPLFTRPKVLVKQSGYSGNNPYVGYSRTAAIQIIPYVRKIGTNEKPVPARSGAKEIKVKQVRRIVNPKGVYRRSGNFEPFHVELLMLPGDGAEKFKSFRSDGPWMAEILGDKNFISLDGKQQVHGSTNTPVDFTIRFNRLNNDNKVRNAIVRVLYNTYTCTHLIFVRQGYAPQAVSPEAKNYDGDNVKAVKWRTFNRISETSDAQDPRDEGSMFKFGNSKQPIHPLNNCFGNTESRSGKGIYYKFPTDFAGDFAVKWNGFWLANDDGTPAFGSGMRVTWGKIIKDDAGFNDESWAEMATMRHFEQLYCTDNVLFGYGVLYADGAKETQYDVDMAYGYYQEDEDREQKGMRGVFAYYYDANDVSHRFTARNLFFPIGRAGYGHRKNGVEGHNDGKGILRYSSSGYENRGHLFNKTAPLFAALYYRPGAIYYAKNMVTGFLDWSKDKSMEPNAVGMDLNYFSFDVNAIGSVSLGNGNDACFVRFVDLSEPPPSPAKRKGRKRQ